MHEKWKAYLPYLEKTVGIKKPEEMAQELGLEYRELYLFLHRSRRFKVNTKFNLCIKLLSDKFIYPEYFSPTARFFEAVGIGRRRWWQLYRGDKEMTTKEYFSVCRHFKMNEKETLDVAQQDLFSDDL